MLNLVRKERDEMRIPGKLSARPVQQPATPAFMTVEKKTSQIKSAVHAKQYLCTIRGFTIIFPTQSLQKADN